MLNFETLALRAEKNNVVVSEGFNNFAKVFDVSGTPVAYANCVLSKGKVSFEIHAGSLETMGLFNSLMVGKGQANFTQLDQMCSVPVVVSRSSDGLTISVAKDYAKGGNVRVYPSLETDSTIEPVGKYRGYIVLPRDTFNRSCEHLRLEGTSQGQYKMKLKFTTKLSELPAFFAEAFNTVGQKALFMECTNGLTKNSKYASTIEGLRKALRPIVEEVVEQETTEAVQAEA